VHAQAVSHKLHVMLYSSPFVSRFLHVALQKLHAMLCILWPTQKDHCVGENILSKLWCRRTKLLFVALCKPSLREKCRFVFSIVLRTKKHQWLQLFKTWMVPDPSPHLQIGKCNEFFYDEALFLNLWTIIKLLYLFVFLLNSDSVLPKYE